MVKENFIIKTEVFMMVCGEKIKCTAKEFYIIHLENLLMTVIGLKINLKDSEYCIMKTLLNWMVNSIIEISI